MVLFTEQPPPFGGGCSGFGGGAAWCAKKVKNRKNGMSSAVLPCMRGPDFTLFTLFSKKGLIVSGKCVILLPS